jgi:putative ABC transport system permease protein
MLLHHLVYRLSRAPSFTATVLLCLAIGVGATTAVAGVLYRLVLQSLPYPQPQKLAMVWEADLKSGDLRIKPSAPLYADLKQRSRSFAGLAAFNVEPRILTGAEPAQRVTAAATTGGFLSAVLGIRPQLGRLLTAEEESGKAGCLVVLSDRFWRQRFGSDRGALGRPLVLDGKSCTTVGVLPAGFEFENPEPDSLQRIDLWKPLSLDWYMGLGRGTHALLVMGRLRPGVRAGQAQAELETLAAALRRETRAPQLGLSLVDLQRQIVGGLGGDLRALLAAGAVFLIIACANVILLLLLQEVQRRRETAIRSALGASRRAIFWQILLETSLLSLFGGVLGLLMSFWGADLLLAASPLHLPRLDEPEGYGSYFAVALGLSLLAALAFSLVALGLARRAEPGLVLGETSSWGAGDRKGASLRKTVVVAEIALTVVLLTCGGLILKSLWQLGRLDLGFDSADLVTLKVELSTSRYSSDEKIRAFFAELLEGARRLRGVEAVALAKDLPLSGEDTTVGYRLPGQERAPGSTALAAGCRIVTPGFFRALRIPVLQGRPLERGDDGRAPGAVVVSATLAARSWPQGGAVGREIQVDWFGRPLAARVVGVVKDIRHASLSAGPQADIYVPLAQLPYPVMQLLARSPRGDRADRAALVAELRTLVAALDRDIPLDQGGTQEDLIARLLAKPRFYSGLLVALGSLALVLSGVGVYGVVAYSVSQEAPANGIRLALGAPADDLRRRVLRRGMTMILLGLLLGLPAAVVASRLVASLLFRVEPSDPTILLGISLLLAAIGFLASYLPAVQAARIDPMVVVRHE